MTLKYRAVNTTTILIILVLLALPLIPTLAADLSGLTGFRSLGGIGDGFVTVGFATSNHLIIAKVGDYVIPSSNFTGFATLLNITPTLCLVVFLMGAVITGIMAVRQRELYLGVVAMALIGIGFYLMDFLIQVIANIPT